MKSILILAFFISSGIIVAGTGITEELASASRLYDEGNYADALDIWHKLEKDGNTDPNLYVNIGSAESLLGHTAESILAFEKASRLKPWDRQIAEAIKKERASIENAIIPVRPFFLLEWYRDYLAIFRPGTWVFIGLIILLITTLQWLLSARRNYKFQIIRHQIWYVMGIGFVCLVSGVLSYYQLHRKDEGVVLKTCDCRQAASSESPSTRKLSPGEKVKLLDHVGDWDKISLLNLDECWIERGCYDVIMIGVR